MSPPSPSLPTKTEHASLALEAWKKVVQTQEHFNEICMKVRTLYATVLAAILSLYGVFLKEPTGHGFEIVGLSFDPILMVLIAVFVSTTLFYFVDKEWYHRLLLGAVNQGAAIEDRWKDILPEIQLGSKISANSPVDLSKNHKLVWFLKLFINDPRFNETMRLHSDAKVQVFYKPIQILAFVFFVVACFFGGIEYDGHSIVGWLWQVVRDCCV